MTEFNRENITTRIRGWNQVGGRTGVFGVHWEESRLDITLDGKPFVVFHLPGEERQLENWMDFWEEHVHYVRLHSYGGANHEQVTSRIPRKVFFWIEKLSEDTGHTRSSVVAKLLSDAYRLAHNRKRREEL